MDEQVSDVRLSSVTVVSKNGILSQEWDISNFIVGCIVFM